MRNWVLNAYKRGILTNSLNNFFFSKKKDNTSLWTSLAVQMYVCLYVNYIHHQHQPSLCIWIRFVSPVKGEGRFFICFSSFFLTWSNSIYLCKYWATCIFVKVVSWSLVGQVSVCTAENLHAPSTTVHTLHLNTVLSCNCIPAMQSFMMGSFF